MDQRTYNPRTCRLAALAGDGKTIRLTASDRAFLRDLAKVQMVSFSQASQVHYAGLKTKGTRSLPRLVQAGIIKERTVFVTGKSPIKIYEFTSHEMAVAWGGRLPNTGRSRSDYHELITSDVYFKLGRPEDFRLPGRFSRDDFSLVGQHVPDALYTDSETGELVLFEADAGNYSQQQIRTKVVSWQARGLRQLWAQPKNANSIIKKHFSVELITV